VLRCGLPTSGCSLLRIRDEEVGRFFATGVAESSTNAPVNPLTPHPAGRRIRRYFGCPEDPKGVETAGQARSSVVTLARRRGRPRQSCPARSGAPGPDRLAPSPRDRRGFACRRSTASRVTRWWSSAWATPSCCCRRIILGRRCSTRSQSSQRTRASSGTSRRSRRGRQSDEAAPRYGHLHLRHQCQAS